ncbi:hypothetical protein FY528_14695 [Hymenobacter lutimineralis]|uniref:Uncharacterized protein n=1 Tax=Hymenobacter lutimineralis TaxID=2606448 RepID=A0A5D6UX87_9BACT|nr:MULTISPECIES: hypothetical protein [Hymenobacter]QIX62708.1 hypothetical protein HER32_16630 [Hymenobacter sp. BT18]TYZ07607.1 hypothetical protein FY528_14695 [Hymenobacter lutimineralis]
MKSALLTPKAPAASRQPWIRSAAFDGLWILGPPFLALLAVVLVPPVFRTSAQMPVWAWVILVVFIDVAHVYSTLFRTYFDPVRRRRFRTLLWLVPLTCYATGVALHWVAGLWFWRVLAYAAVFHFVRQQYGFLRLYSRHETTSLFSRRLDTVLVYAATLYPLLWWHLSPPRNFNWFVTSDFVQYDWPAARGLLTALYVALLVAYLVKEIRRWHHTRQFNRPRNLLLLGTAASWYVGIVLFNGDLAFTLLNVVAHGIPYLALIWATSQPASHTPARAQSWWQRRYGIALALGLLFGLAYLEEGIWDGLVWREHAGAFGLFQQLPPVSDSLALSLLVPLLALPQATHYVLDGFIWRRNS